jgi:hypothetical protein
MAKRKTPLDRLLAAIEAKRRLSLSELGKTDLYGGTAADDVTAWYDRLSALARETPPTEGVAALRIIENERGDISGLEYTYRDKKTAQPTGQETVFVIETKIF